MERPLVSVNMLTYNHRPYIVKAIEGVMAQKTAFPIELLIGEDCSTDGTRDIAFQYEKEYPDTIRVVTSKENVGPRRNGLRVIDASRGKYIAFCEGDDYWHKEDKLQKQVNFLESNPDYGLVYTDYDRHYVKKRKTIHNAIHQKAASCPQPPTITELLSGKTGIQTLTVLAETALVQHFVHDDPYLYQEGPFMMGDTQLWAEISMVKKIHYMDDSTATHLILPESATQSDNLSKKLRFRISGSELCIYLANKHNLPESLIDRHRTIADNLALKIALLENDADGSRRVWRTMKKKSIKQTMLYYINIMRPLRKLFVPLYLPYERSKW